MKRFINLSYGLLIGIFLVFFIALQGVRIIGLNPYVVTTGSMIPMYPVGTMIYVKDVEPQTIEVGDSITFYLEGSNVPATHQVWKIDKDNQLFYTQGINNFDAEGNILKDSSPVPFNKIIGKPVFSVPLLGVISQKCISPPGIYIIAGFVILYCMFLFILEQFIEGGKEK